MIKYFIFNYTSVATNYGIGTYTNHLVDILKSYRTYDIYIVDTCTAGGDVNVVQDMDGVCRIQIPHFYEGTDVRLAEQALHYVIFQYVNNEPCIFHFNFSIYNNLARLLKANISHCYILYTLHCMNWAFPLFGNQHKFHQIINGEYFDEDNYRGVIGDYYSTKSFYAFCDRIICLSKFTKKLLINEYSVSEKKLDVIYNGIKEIKTIKTHNQKKQKSILYVGRLDDTKGIQFLIMAYKRLLTRIHDIRLFIVGNGLFDEYLKYCDGIWDKVSFTGRLSHEQIEEMYNTATIGVLPSFNEQCSYSAIEMMSHGIPLIATDSTGLGEMMDVTPECCVHIDEERFDAESFEKDLSKKMEYVLTDKIIRKEIVEKQHVLFNERYSYKKLLNSMKDMYRRIDNELSDTILSDDFLPYLDKKMFSIIDMRPDLDFEMVGFTGLGLYLLVRKEETEKKHEESTCLHIQEYLVYLLDWICFVVENEGQKILYNCEKSALSAFVNQLKNTKFYPSILTKIKYMLSKHNVYLCDAIEIPSIKDVYMTALKLYTKNE